MQMACSQSCSIIPASSILKLKQNHMVNVVEATFSLIRIMQKQNLEKPKITIILANHFIYI
uniref:Uncharacterized protein n=1 Tax=Arundo donax TaxID=35708 RepID=A0A0A9DZQ9_ARUDO